MATVPTRNAIWSYVKTAPGPIAGPQPRLARGTGRTGKPGAAGTGPQLPAYVSEPDYTPVLNAYAPRTRLSFLERIPKTIHTGEDGTELVGTYTPHDFTPAQRMLHHLRSAAAWQQQFFPPDFRNLLQWQQARKYQVMTQTLAARPLDRSDYFLGYRIDPSVAASFGGFNALGSLGSNG